MTNKDTILVDTWQAKFDMIPVDVELIESKTSKKVKVFVDGKLFKIYPVKGLLNISYLFSYTI